MTAVRRAGRAVRWYVRAVTGESKWDDYLQRCRAAGVDPVSRRQFERQRAERTESATHARCC